MMPQEVMEQGKKKPIKVLRSSKALDLIFLPHKKKIKHKKLFSSPSAKTTDAAVSSDAAAAAAPGAPPPLLSGSAGGSSSRLLYQSFFKHQLFAQKLSAALI